MIVGLLLLSAHDPALFRFLLRFAEEVLLEGGVMAGRQVVPRRLCPPQPHLDHHLAPSGELEVPYDLLVLLNEFVGRGLNNIPW